MKAICYPIFVMALLQTIQSGLPDFFLGTTHQIVNSKET
jgi:hypothetical protein